MCLVTPSLNLTHLSQDCKGFLCLDIMSGKNGVHKGGIVHLMASDHKILVLTPAQYLEEMSKLKTYCTDLELCVLSNTLNSQLIRSRSM